MTVPVAFDDVSETNLATVDCPKLPVNQTPPVHVMAAFLNLLPAGVHLALLALVIHHLADVEVPWMKQLRRCRISG